MALIPTSPDEVLRLAGARLKALRESLDISQRQLAEHARVHSSVVSRLEAGADARLSTWAKLFYALGAEFNVVGEADEEAAAWMRDEGEARRERRKEGLERRWW